MPIKFLEKYGGSLLSAGGDLVSGVVNNLFANSAARKQHEREKELMDLENQYAIDMFNRTNAYNTPSQQMKRFREAGLNPNLMYGNGSAASGNADMPSAPSSGTAAKAEYPGIGNLGSSAYQAYGESLQFKSIEANNARTLAETLNIKQKTLNDEVDQLIKLEDLWSKSRDNYIQDSSLPQLLREKKLTVDKLQQDINESVAREEDYWSRRDVNLKTLELYESQLKNDKVMRNLNRAKFGQVMALARRADLENQNFGTFLSEIQSRTGLNRAEAGDVALKSVVSYVVALRSLTTGEPVSSLWGFIDKKWGQLSVSVGKLFDDPDGEIEQAKSIINDILNSLDSPENK